MVAVNWSEVLQIVERLIGVYGLIAGLILLAIVLTRPAVCSLLERKWVLFISAGLTLGGIFAVALAFHVTNGHPQPYNALLWIGLTCFITALWRLITRPSV